MERLAFQRIVLAEGKGWLPQRGSRLTLCVEAGAEPKQQTVGGKRSKFAASVLERSSLTIKRCSSSMDSLSQQLGSGAWSGA